MIFYDFDKLFDPFLGLFTKGSRNINDEDAVVRETLTEDLKYWDQGNDSLGFLPEPIHLHFVAILGVVKFKDPA